MYLLLLVITSFITNANKVKYFLNNMFLDLKTWLCFWWLMFLMWLMILFWKQIKFDKKILKFYFFFGCVILPCWLNYSIGSGSKSSRFWMFLAMVWIWIASKSHFLTNISSFQLFNAKQNVLHFSKPVIHTCFFQFY